MRTAPPPLVFSLPGRECSQTENNKKNKMRRRERGEKFKQRINVSSMCEEFQLIFFKDQLRQSGLQKCIILYLYFGSPRHAQKNHNQEGVLNKVFLF
jgi:hypothetical protein